RAGAALGGDHRLPPALRRLPAPDVPGDPGRAAAPDRRVTSGPFVGTCPTSGPFAGTYLTAVPFAGAAGCTSTRQCSCSTTTASSGTAASTPRGTTVSCRSSGVGRPAAA